MALGIYVQVPFCQTKCTYCNFHTGVVSEDRYRPYADAVCREAREAPFTPSLQAGAPVIADTIYFGGGTPSLLDPASLAAVLQALGARFTIHEPEITLEADPETITLAKAAAWQAAGFNRISLGVQSFDDRELTATGRMHRRQDIFAANQVLRAAGLDNISMDLIAGLPHQTADTWDRSLTQLLALRPEHVSVYILEVDEGSRLGKESLAGGSRYSAAAIPSEDQQADFYELAGARLAGAGYEHYEISNWALPGRRSRHNIKYWTREPYLGIGAGAHSFDGRDRWANLHDAPRYVQTTDSGASTREQLQTLTPEEALSEELFLGLRQLDGINLAALERRHGGSGGTLAPQLSSIRLTVNDLLSRNLVLLDGDRLRLNPATLAISNEALAALILPPAPTRP